MKDMPRNSSDQRENRARRLSRGWKITTVIVAALLTLWIASEIAIPAIASSYIKREIKNKYPKAREVSVSVSAFPALRLAFKQYSRLEIKVNGITLEGINFDKIELKSNRWPDGVFTSLVSPDEIMRFFSLSYSYVLQPTITLEHGKIQVSGRIDLGYAVAGITATGNLKARDGRQVFFEPEDISADKVKLTAPAVESIRQIMATNPVFVIRDDLPFTVTEVTATGGALQTRGSVNLEKALEIKL